MSGIVVKNFLPLSKRCAGIRIMSLRFYSSLHTLPNLWNVVSAVKYATRMGADIVNFSGGGTDRSFSENKAVEEAAAEGVLFVVAAGNNGQDLALSPYYPASYGIKNVISVAASGQDGRLIDMSNYGAVDLSAPGEMVMSTLPNNSYGELSGTSMAVPYVTALAASLMARYPGSNKLDRATRVAHWLKASGVQKPLLHRTRYGEASVSRALEIQRHELRSAR